MATDRTAARKRARPAPVEPQAPDLDVLEDACCPITLEVFRDPVTLAQSGITYERAALEDALARQPGVDPETNKEFDGAPTIVANHTLRRLIASLSAKRDKEDDAAATNEDAAHRRPPKSPAAADEAEAPAPTEGKAGGAPKKRAKKLTIEGAFQKANGKWTCPFMFPGREFDDLDEYRAAKKQRAERRAAYSHQARSYK